MVDVSKLKKRGGLGTPPTLDEAATSLTVPEVAPAPLEDSPTALTPSPVPDASSANPPAKSKAPARQIFRDGRSARTTNRTLAFATRVTPEFDREIRYIAERENLKLVEVLEKGIEALKEKLNYKNLK